MKWTYDDCLKHILTQVERYKTARRKNEWDKQEFAAIRANISEALLMFGSVYAGLRSQAEQAKLNLKLFEIARRKHWRAEIPKSRGSVGEIDTLVLEESVELMQKEVDANALYYQAKALMERADQELNAISSHIKLLNKNE